MSCVPTHILLTPERTQRTRLFHTVRLWLDDDSEERFQRDISAETYPSVKCLRVVHSERDLTLPSTSVMRKLNALHSLEFKGLSHYRPFSEEAVRATPDPLSTLASPVYRSLTVLRIEWCQLTPLNVLDILRLPKLCTLVLIDCLNTSHQEDVELRVKAKVAQLESSPISDLTLERTSLAHLQLFLPLLSNITRIRLRNTRDESSRYSVLVQFPALQHLDVSRYLFRSLSEADTAAQGNLVAGLRGLTLEVDRQLSEDIWFWESDAILGLLRPARDLRYLELRITDPPPSALSGLLESLRRGRPLLQVVC